MSRRKRFPTASDVGLGSDFVPEDQTPAPSPKDEAVGASETPPATLVAEKTETPSTGSVEAAGADPMPTIDFPPAFERSYLKVLRHEGGFVDHPRDPGGATNLGISLRYARTRGSMFDLDGDGDVDAADIRLVTPENAAAAYFEDFWVKVRAGELPPGLDHLTFDAAVNSGPGRAIRWLQHAVGATVDGAFGPRTMQAVHQAVERDGIIPVIDRAIDQRLAFMRGLDWATFGRGWQRRVDGVRLEAHKIALGMPL